MFLEEQNTYNPFRINIFPGLFYCQSSLNKDRLQTSFLDVARWPSI